MEQRPPNPKNMKSSKLQNTLWEDLDVKINSAPKPHPEQRRMLWAGLGLTILVLFVVAWLKAPPTAYILVLGTQLMAILTTTRRSRGMKKSLGLDLQSIFIIQAASVTSFIGLAWLQAGLTDFVIATILIANAFNILGRKNRVALFLDFVNRKLTKKRRKR